MTQLIKKFLASDEDRKFICIHKSSSLDRILSPTNPIHTPILFPLGTVLSSFKVLKTLHHRPYIA